MLRLAAVVCAALAGVWAALDPRSFDAEGFLGAPIALPIACAAVGLAVGVFGGSLGPAVRWIALFALGQAALLQLTVAGPVVSYQHLRPWNVATDPWLAVPLGIVGLQAIAVAFGLRPFVGRWLAGLTAVLGRWRLAAVALAIAFSCAKVSFERYPIELAFAFVARLVQVANLALAVAALTPSFIERSGPVFDRWFGPAAGEPERRLDRFGWIAALVAGGAAALLAVVAYERHPHVPDEVVYLLHARYLAAGLFELPLPDVAEAFDIDIMLPIAESDTWYSPVPIGWPLALAVGAWLGAAWLVNPFLTVVAVLLAYLFLQEITTRRNARLGVLLLVASPWFVFMGTNFMTHQWTLTSALIGGLGVARARRTGGVAWAALAGLGTGMVGLVRPLEGVGLAVCLGLWAIGFGGARVRLAATAALVVVTTAVGSLQLAYNARMTGDPKTFPIMLYVDRTYGVGKNSIGFGPEKGLDWPGLDPRPGHDLVDCGLNAHFNTFAIDFELFGWSIGSLLLVYLALVAGRWSRTDRAMLTLIVVIVGLNSLYWFSGGPDFGARYWYLVLIPCVALTLSGRERVEAWLAEAGDEHASARTTAAVLLLAACAAVNVFPWRAIDKYHHYRGMRPDVRTLAAEHAFGDALVIVQGERHPDAASALVYNALDPTESGTLYAWDFDPAQRVRTIERYALPTERPVWIVAGPSVTGRGYEVVAGPLAPRDALLSD